MGTQAGNVTDYQDTDANTTVLFTENNQLQEVDIRRNLPSDPSNYSAVLTTDYYPDSGFSNLRAKLHAGARVRIQVDYEDASPHHVTQFNWWELPKTLTKSADLQRHELGSSLLTEQLANSPAHAPVG